MAFTFTYATTGVKKVSSRVYIRAATTPLYPVKTAVENWELASFTTFLATFQELGAMESGGSHGSDSSENITLMNADRITISENVKMETFLIHVSKTSWEALRDSTNGLHNKSADVLFYDLGAVRSATGVNGSGVIYGAVPVTFHFIGAENGLYKVACRFETETADATEKIKLFDVIADV